MSANVPGYVWDSKLRRYVRNNVPSKPAANSAPPDNTALTTALVVAATLPAYSAPEPTPSSSYSSGFDSGSTSSFDTGGSF